MKAHPATPQTDPERNTTSLIERRKGALLVLVLIVAGASNLVALFRYPRPLVDEVELVGRAWGYVLSGQTIAPLRPSLQEYNVGVSAPVQLLGTWIFALPVRIFGPDLWAARIESLVFSLLLLLATYTIGKELYGPGVGLIASLLLGSSTAFGISSHIARYDALVALAGFGAIALVLRGGRWRVPRSGLAGLSIGLAFEIHGNAALFGPPIIVLILSQRGRGSQRGLRIISFAAGVGAGLAWYALVHILPGGGSVSPDVANLVLSPDGIKRPPIAFLNPEVLAASALDTVTSLVSYEQWRTIPLALAIVTLGYRRRRSDLLLIGGFACLLIEWVALLSYKPFYYGILIAPAAELIVAAGLAASATGLWSRAAITVGRFGVSSRVSLLLVGVYAGFIVASIASLIASQVDKDVFADSAKTNAGLRSVLPAGARLVGDHTLWFGLSDYRWVAWPYLPIELRKSPGSSLADAYRSLGGDYLIVGPDLLWNVTDDPGDRPSWARWQNISKSDWDSFIARYGEVVTEVTTQSLGKVSVYRIRSN